MFYKLDFYAYTIKMLGFVWSFWFFKNFAIFVIFGRNLTKWSYQLHKKTLFVNIGSNLDQKWQNSQIVCKCEKFEKNLKFWPYKEGSKFDRNWLLYIKKKLTCKTAKFHKISFFFGAKNKIEKKNSKKWQNCLKISDFCWKKLFVGSNFNPIYFCEFVFEFNSEYIKMLGMYTMIGY